jgi:hypothetical protein
MQPNIQPHQPLPTSAKRVFFPVTRFIGDTNEKNQVIADRHGNPVSGNFTVAIHEQVKEAAPLVASITENVKWSRFQMYREETDAMNVEGLMEYFPELRVQYDSYMGIVEDDVADDDDEEEKTDEEEPTPKSTKTARKANGKSGSKKAKQEGQGSDQVTAEEVAA